MRELKEGRKYKEKKKAHPTFPYTQKVESYQVWRRV